MVRLRCVTAFSALALTLLFLLLPVPADNGRHSLAQEQFDRAKAAYAAQDFPRAVREAYFCALNAPSSGAPWFLLGSSFYLAGQDAAALSHYAEGLRRNPGAGRLPPFYAHLRRRVLERAPLSRWTEAERERARRLLGQRLLVSVPGTRLSGGKRTLLERGYVGGVVLFGPNIRSREQLAAYIRELQAASAVPLFVAVDQEGGAVRRLREEHGFTRLPSPAALGRTGDSSLAYRFGRVAGRQLSEVGINLNFAPVVDLDRKDPASVITRHHRSLGGDPDRVSDLASQIVRGMREEGVIATAKHFPGQTLAAEDPHHDLSRAGVPWSQALREDLEPYRRLIREGLEAIMLSHVVHPEVDPVLPASLSPQAVRMLLRGDLGFQGLVITDDLRMKAVRDRFPPSWTAVQALQAGADLVIVTDNSEQRVLRELVEAAERGELSREDLEEPYSRILKVKQRYGLLERRFADQRRRSVGHRGAWPNLGDFKTP